MRWLNIGRKRDLIGAPPLYNAHQQCLFGVVHDIGTKAINNFLVVTIGELYYLEALSYQA